ncbi:MAG: energy transducer TonB [Oxalobacteraceae bacterium]
MRTMKNALIASSASLLFGCNALSMLKPQSSVVPLPRSAASASPALRESQASHLDAYKNDVAQHILAGNADAIFSGRLPPMLPAIVVVSISIDADGQLRTAVVQRSRDHKASRVALASLKRVTPYPKPVLLLRSGSKLLEFSETFLFNADYKFQLRTLAGPQ